jgi:hypothetical protein
MGNCWWRFEERRIAGVATASAAINKLELTVLETQGSDDANETENHGVDFLSRATVLQALRRGAPRFVLLRLFPERATTTNPDGRANRVSVFRASTKSAREHDVAIAGFLEDMKASSGHLQDSDYARGLSIRPPACAIKVCCTGEREHCAIHS